MTQEKTPAATEVTTSAQSSAIVADQHDGSNHELTPLITPTIGDLPFGSRKQFAALSKRAMDCGASLTLIGTRTLMVQRGAASWHCTDSPSVRAVLARLEAAR
jgi:hypothetical protein